MQSKTQSMIETLTSTVVGFVLSVLVWEFIVKPIWDLHTSFVENISITLLFTVVSILRGYVLRRCFNHLHHKNNRKQYEQANRNHGVSP